MSLERLRIPGIVLLAILCLALAAPAALLTAGDDEDDKPDPEVTFAKAHPTARPEAGKALLNVVRPTSGGIVIKSHVFVDDDVIGINRGSSYVFAQVEPGKRAVWSKSENVDALELTVEAGKTYYVQEHVRMDGLTARTRLEVLDAAAGEKALANCKKHGDLTSKGVERGRKIAEEHKAAVQKDLDRRARESEKKGKKGD